MGWISADAFDLFGFDVSFLVAVVGFFLFFFFPPQKLPSSFCSVIDIHKCISTR